MGDDRRYFCKVLMQFLGISSASPDVGWTPSVNKCPTWPWWHETVRSCKNALPVNQLTGAVYLIVKLGFFLIQVFNMQ